MSLNRIPCLAACLCLTVALAACGGGGDDDDNSNDKASEPTPCTTPSGFVDEAGANQNVKTNTVVQLDGTASRGAGGDRPDSYQWSFVSRPNGSGAQLTSATSAAPQFTADQAGRYVVQLVIDGKNDCDDQTDRVTVTATAPGTNAVPTADAGADQSVGVGAGVKLSGANSHDPDGDTLSYAWQFVSRPDGSSAKLAGAKTVSPSFKADKAGTYVVGLRVADGKATSERDTITVVAAAGGEARPVADAGPDQSVRVDSLVRLDGTGSRDPEDRLISYHWHFVSKPGASAAAITGTDTAQAVFRPDAAGTYVVSLTVANGQTESRPDTVIVTASKPNVRPTADAGADRNVKTGLVVELDGSASSDPDGDELNYRWRFVSIPDGSGTALTGGATATPAFTPDVAGQYVLQLVVDDGRIDSTADTVVVSAASANSAPVAEAGGDRNVAVGSRVTLDGGASSDADNDTLAYHWTLVSRPAGSAATLTDADTATPDFTADVVGFYAMTLTVNDGRTDSEPDLVVITATPTLALYVRQNDSYRRVDGNGGTASIQVPIGGKNVLLDHFRVEALGSDFTIANVQTMLATTPDGQTLELYLDGLSSGDVIDNGDHRDFAAGLRSVPDAPGKYQVELRFTVNPGGKRYRLAYDVTID
ncbi:PKD domain-containing protein [Salinisphaera sp.]|uniref:PKD domain-containing protein n=1 Tax=Salinisphaera sp. TaxID=1914330 RepID=UPI002D7792A3|nr:PKD domain-containing protein [Salinisphaera sp.]HET7313185.1 PKD domain-containing protein [Salinisphaera sp.]